MSRVVLIICLMLCITGAFAALYILMLRPVLRRWSVLKAFWAETDAFEISLWEKLREVFDGLKIKLLARLMWVPGIIVYAYDNLLPMLTGIDITPLTAALPPWAAGVLLPLVGTVLIPILIDWARSSSSSPQPPGA